MERWIYEQIGRLVMQAFLPIIEIVGFSFLIFLCGFVVGALQSKKVEK